VTADRSAAERRARRLLRCYPPAWRARYGEEFTQLLVADISERPRSVLRTIDVLRTGLLSRLSYAGLTGDVLDPAQQIRTGVGMIGLAVVAFLIAGVALWAQLAIGWQWAAPADRVTRAGMVAMSACALVLVVLAALAALPLGWALVRGFVAGERGVRVPTVAAAAGIAVLAVGSVHFGHGWPGTGGHPWAGRGLVPGPIARVSWAVTLWVTAYWGHPSALASFPASELWWMVASPVALLIVVAGTGLALSRLPLSGRLLRYESWLGLAAGLVMAVFLAGAASWVISGGGAPRGLFRAGAIDAVDVALMSAALALAFRSARRALLASAR